MNMLKLFDAARHVSVPILAIRTADQQATTAEIVKAESPELAIVQWDAARGLTPANAAGGEALKKLGASQDETVGFVEAMTAILSLPRGAIVVAHNAHRQLHAQEPMAVAAQVQAVANLRDQFKRNFRMLVLAGPAFVAPPELEHDIVVVDHELPDPEVLGEIVKQLHVSAKMTLPASDVIGRAVDAVSGLSRFAAEQVAAMSFTDTGLDLDALWERKRVTIEQTQGLGVWRGGERFYDLVGLGAIKTHLRRRLKSRTPVGVVVWLDEIDKVLANVESDTSGVRMDQLRTLLTEMENHEWCGLVAVGVPGGGKSAIAKAFGNEAGVPTIALDLGGMESKYVGESEAALRQAMSIIRAIGRGHAYVMATSNNASVMRPELQRRFTDGLWFFDLMTADERAAAWAAYMRKYELAAQSRPDDGEWTGAEIRNCCRYAWDTGCTLVEAAQFIVPMARSRADDVERLRRFAHGRFLDATTPGVYSYRPEPMEQAVRAIALPAQALDTIAKMPES